MLEDGKLLAGDPMPQDTLIIEKVDDSHAHIIVESTQTNGAECSADGVAERNGDKLIYTEKGPIGAGDQFELFIFGGVIKLRYLKDSGLGIPPFCGSRGRLDRLEFALKSARPAKQP